MFRSIRRTPVLLRRHVWTWPVVAAVVLGAVGWFLRGAIETELRDEVRSSLATIRDAEIEALELWIESREDAVEAVAESDDFRELALRQLELGADESKTTADLLSSDESSELEEVISEHVDRHDFDGYAILLPEGRVVAADLPAAVGFMPERDESRDLFARARAGVPIVTQPVASQFLLEDRDGAARVGVPTMFAVAPVRDDDEHVAGLLLLRIQPWDKFTEILQIAQVGKSGETYAFNRDGLMVSQSRFDDSMREHGILGPREESILTIAVRDPGGNLTRGYRSATPAEERPLTRSAEAAVAGDRGATADPYRDYRGVPVVGAWAWIEQGDFGIATEIDASEAFGPLYIVRTAFWTMFGLLALASVAIFFYTVRAEQAKSDAARAALEAKQLGQYQLEEELGRGGMGVVYRAHHQMLRRPTAVKFLDVDKATEQSIARFEREVQATSQLTHPNTIAIYDYGRSDEGIFFYAMEYLEGVDLGDLVKDHGPLPESRVIHLLQQIAGSLAEAHDTGLVHRDVKPANVMLTIRGGIADFVKVLDFGLVKVVDEEKEAKLTAAGTVTGTPLYMSPESIRDRDHVDGRSDLYAVGAVGYYLLTGTPPFHEGNAFSILKQHVDAEPQSPSVRAGRTIDADLETLLLKCLAKSPSQRPSSARDLVDALDRCRASGGWSRQDATNWWRSYGATWSIDPDKTFASAEATTISEPGRDDSSSASDEPTVHGLPTPS